MKRILQIMSSLHRNGTETAIMNIYRHLDHSLYQFDFLIFDDDRMDFYHEIKQLGGNVFVISNRKRNFLRYFIDCWSFFKKNHNKYDIVHFNFCYLSIMWPFLLGYIYKIPKRIIHSHSSNYVGGKYNLILHKLFRRINIRLCNRYIACSKEAKEWFYRNTIVEKKCNVILNGINLQRFSYNRKIRQEYRNLLSVEENTLVIAQVGYFAQVKNHFFSINLIKKLKDQIPNLKVFFIGEGGNLEKEIAEKIMQLGLSDTIQLLGRRNDIHKIFQAIDILIHPSLFEGLPLTLIEAQTSGLQVITSDKVSKDSKCTENISFLPIDQGIDIWINQIFNLLKYNRRNQYPVLRKSNFNIENTIKSFISYYND